jgi:hypothetical protein
MHPVHAMHGGLLTPHAQLTNDSSGPGSLKKYRNLNEMPFKNCRACCVIDTSCTIFAFENRSYIGEFEAEFKKALARESGAQGYCLMKKTDGRKFRDTVPLNVFNLSDPLYKSDAFKNIISNIILCTESPPPLAVVRPELFCQSLL